MPAFFEWIAASAPAVDSIEFLNPCGPAWRLPPRPRSKPACLDSRRRQRLL